MDALILTITSILVTAAAAFGYVGLLVVLLAGLVGGVFSLFFAVRRVLAADPAPRLREVRS